jgi:hypothetical protein
MLIVLAEQSTNTLSTALVQIHAVYSQLDHGNASSNTPLQERDHPDQDFYQNSSWTHSLIYIMVAYAIITMMVIVVLSGLNDNNLITLLIPTMPSLFSYFPISTVLTFWVFIILSMLLEDIGGAQGNVLRCVVGVTRKNFIRWCKIFISWHSLIGGITAMIVVSGVGIP